MKERMDGWKKEKHKLFAFFLWKESICKPCINHVLVFSNITKWKVCISQHHLKKISAYMAIDGVSSVPGFPQWRQILASARRRLQQK